MSGERRSTHDVFRIGHEFSWQETPYFCPGRWTHSILDALPTLTAEARTPDAPASSLNVTERDAL